MNENVTTTTLTLKHAMKRRRQEGPDEVDDKDVVVTTAPPTSSQTSRNEWDELLRQTDGSQQSEAAINHGLVERMSTVPQSDFDFTLPLHSYELGSLPVWPDSAMGGVPTDTSWMLSAAEMYTSQPPMADPSTLSADDQNQQLLDPELEAIFSEVMLNGSYGGPFGVLPQAHTGHGSNQSLYDQGFPGRTYSDSSMFSQSPISIPVNTAAPLENVSPMWDGITRTN